MKHLIFKQLIWVGLALNTIFTFNLAGQNPIESICTDTFKQQYPSFWGDRIVWQDYRNGNWDIYMYDLLTDTDSPICTTSYTQTKPSIWGDRIVWQEARNSQWDIYMYDIVSKTVTAICTAAYDQNNPVISGDIIVWQDNRDMNWDIYLYDLGEAVESPVTTHDGNQTMPTIWNNRIVWEDNRNGNSDIYMYDISTDKEKAICTDKADQRNPTIWGNRILWEDYRNGNCDIYMRYLNYFTSSDPPEDLEFWALTVYIDNDYDTPANQTVPKISGNTLAFQDDRSGILKISTYNFHDQLWGDLVSVDSLQVKQQNPAVSDERVVWQDLRNGNDVNENWDIYMWTRPAGADLAISHRAYPDPVGVYQYLTYTLNIFNHGPMTATGVLVKDKPCGDVEMYSMTSTLGVCSFDTGVVSCNIDSIPANNYVTITIVVQPTKIGDICNKAYVSGITPDYIQSNNYTCRIVTVDKYLQNQIGKGYHPSIALDKHKKAHISYATDYIGDMVYKNNTTGSWIKKIIDNSGGAYISEITADRDGNMHLAYVLRDPDAYPLAYLQYTNNVDGYWKQEETIGQSADGIWALSFKTDSRNKVHVNYIATTGSASGGPLIYINDTSGTWIVDTLGYAYDHASMTLDSNDNAHISFYIGGSVLYMTNAPDGIWHDPEQFDAVGGQLEMMVTSIAIGPDNRPHISYVGGSLEDNKYATKTDTGWQLTLIDSGGFQSSGNSIAVDSAGTIHIVYHHIPIDWYSGNPVTLNYATNASGSWEKEVLDPDGGMENAIAVDKNGDVHISYASYNGVQYIWKMNGNDSDHDGVAGIEEQGPNRNDPSYDGNGDGTPDNQQKDVASLHTNDGSNYVTVAVEDNSLALSDVTAIDNPAPSVVGSPTADKVPYGFFSFKIFGLDAGGSAIVRLYLHGGPHIDTYYKYGPTPDTTWHHWYPFIYSSNIGAEINGDTVVLHLTDGRRGDHDIAANGIIVEPGGPVSYVSGIKEITGILPDEYRLWQNYPNPFNPLTRIQFDIPKTSFVTLKVYDLLGQEVATLVNELKKVGRYEYEFDCSSLSSGVYFYRLAAGDYINTKKLILLK